MIDMWKSYARMEQTIFFLGALAEQSERTATCPARKGRFSWIVGLDF